jgi:CheY-like chemotaxis protein
MTSQDYPTRQSATDSPILLVEDNDDTREVVAMILASEGFSVVTAENGQRGLERLLRARPCLVLLDLMMPVMTGWEFRRAQMSLPDDDLASVPVLLLTAVPDPEQVAAELNVADVIPKPLDFDQLIECVRRHCDHSLP